MSCELKNILWSGKNLREGRKVKGMQTKFDNEEVLLIPKKAVISTDFEPGKTEYRIVVDTKYMVNSVTFNQFIQMIKENGDKE